MDFKLFSRLPWQTGPKGLAAVVPIIPEHGYWTANNNLGSVATFEPDQTGRQMMLKLPEWGPPDLWTVSLGMDFRSDAVFGGDRFALLGEILIGVGGATQSFEVDWLQGTRFTAPMNSISVTALKLEIVTAVEPLILSVMMSRYASGTSSIGATRTLGTSASAGSVGGPVKVPRFARTAQILPVTPGSTTLANDDLIFAATSEYRFRTDLTGAANYAAVYTGNNLAARGGRIIVPPTGNFFEVFNGGATILHTQTMFELGF